MSTDIVGELNRILVERFGLSQFRRGQLDILLSVINKKDTLAVMPTGGGKSLCYQIPALFHEGIVVVITPLIALMKDQVKNLNHLQIPSGCLYSSQTIEEKQEVFYSMKEASHFVLFLSPERVQKPGFASWIKDQKISLFAIDEAHCVSQWGPEFRPDYHKLSLLRELRPDVPILALTATATPAVVYDISEQLDMRSPDRHVYGFYRPNLFYQVESCEDESMKCLILQNALRATPEGRVIVYCGTRKQTEKLYQTFHESFEGMGYYHAGLDDEKRTQVQKDFESGKLRILTATNAFGMGIDHPDVRLIVHYQMPANIETFYQEMGRAGRDGKESTCLLLYSKKDKGLHSYFIRQSSLNRNPSENGYSAAEAEQHIRMRWRSLENMVYFAEGGECRHAGILTYFQDVNRIESCGHCDICSADSSRKISVTFNASDAAMYTELVSDDDIKSSSRLKKSKKVKTKKVKKEYSENLVLNAHAEALAEKLKQWRKEYAKQLDTPAFIIFSNKTLNDLAQKAPAKLSELHGIYGLGDFKIERYGKDILKVIAAFAGN